MLLSRTLLKGTDTKITELYLAAAALAIGQRRRYLLQRLTAYFATTKTEPPADAEAPAATSPDPSERFVSSPGECGVAGAAREPPGHASDYLQD